MSEDQPAAEGAKIIQFPRNNEASERALAPLNELLINMRNYYQATEAQREEPFSSTTDSLYTEYDTMVEKINSKMEEMDFSQPGLTREAVESTVVAIFQTIPRIDPNDHSMQPRIQQVMDAYDQFAEQEMEQRYKEM